MPARGDAAFRATIRFASAPTTRCCAAVGGSAAIRMRHLLPGAALAHLVEVRSNHRKSTRALLNAASARYAISRAALPSSKGHSPHDSKARLMSGRDSGSAASWRSHVHHLHCAARAIIQAINCQCPGSRGTPSPFSEVSGYFGKRIPFGVAARTPLPPSRLREKVRPRAISPRGARAVRTCASGRKKKRALLRALFSNC